MSSAGNGCTGVGEHIKLYSSMIAIVKETNVKNESKFEHHSKIHRQKGC